MKKAAFILAALVAIGLFASEGEGDLATASSPGSTDAPLLSCPDVTGDGPVSALDFFALLGKFATTYASSGTNFAYLYDLNANDSVSGTDFFVLLGRFTQTCPAVDSQLAKATLAIRAMGPGVLDCNEAALAAQGYVRASSDVPGQGVHYVNRDYWDGVFEPEHPEGLVCDNAGGRLIAQLYVVAGQEVGWVEDPGPGPALSPNAGSCWDGIDNAGDGDTDAGDADCISVSPSGSPLDDVHIDPLCNVPDCSWSGDEGWHLHYNLCTIHIGTPSAFAFPGVTSEAQCEANHCYPQIPPCGAVFGVDFNWAPRVGWMGHLWNHKLNENLIADNGGMNGRFADCYPDGGVWKSHNCPQ